MIKLVYFITSLNMVTVTVFLFLKVDPCPSRTRLKGFQIFQCPDVLPELRGKNNLSVSKHKILVWTSGFRIVGVP